MVNNKPYSIYKAGILVSLFFISTLASCGTKEKVWAKVDSTELLEEDALVLMQTLDYDTAKVEDRKAFTQRWIEQQLFILEINNTLPDKAQMIRLKSLWSEGDLSRFYLEENQIREELDTQISDSSILQYFNQHKNEFALNDYIVRALYMKVPKDAPKQDKLKEHYLLKKEKDYSKVISYANLYADNFYYNDSAWVYFDELTKDLPMERLNKDNLVLNRTKTYFSDEHYAYYLNIIDFRLKDATPPIDFLKPVIKQVLVNQKMNELKEKNNASFIQKIKQKYEITSKY